MLAVRKLHFPVSAGWEIRYTRGMKQILIVAALLALTACGFRPVHGQAYQSEQTANLAAVSVQVNKTRMGQLLEAEIADGINPDAHRNEKLYRLSINVTERDIYLFINPDGTAGRGDVELDSAYTLTRLIDGKILQRGKIKRVGSYNISETADYATFVSEEDARKRAVIELAQDYRLRLGNLLARLEAGAAQ